MGKRTWMILAAVGLLAMVAIVAVSAFMGGCAKPVETAAGGTVPMKCHWTFIAATFVGVAIVVGLVQVAKANPKGTERRR